MSASLTIQKNYHHHFASSMRFGGMAIDDAVHEHDAENVIIDPAWVYPNDCYHLNVPSNVELQYQYYIEFTGMTVGVIPPGWTERYLGSQNYTVQNVGQASEQALLMDSTVGTIETICSWNAMTGLVDVELLYSAYIATNQNEQPNFAVRASGSIGSEYFYVLSGLVTSNQLRINKWVNGSRSQLGAAVSKTLNTTTWYWVRFRVVGNELKAKVWAGGSSEPTAWDIERTDSAITGGGWIGPQCGDWNNAYWYTAAISVGTGGATANYILGVFDSNHEHYADQVVFPLSINQTYHEHFAEAAYVYSISGTYHSHVGDSADIFSINGAYHPHDGQGIGIFNSNVIPNPCDHNIDDNDGNPLSLGVTISVEECYHEHESDTFALTVTLGVSECYHDIDDNDGSPITLRETIALEDCYHLNVPDENLGLDISIQVAETYHAHASPQAALTVNLLVNETYHEHFTDAYLIIPLLVNALEHEHFADNTILGVDLSINDSYLIHTCDNTVLDQVTYTLLTIAESYHLFNTEFPNESIDLILTPTVQEAYHDIDSDTVGLNVHLAINNVSHETFSDNIEIDQSFINPADNYHSVASDNVALAVNLVVAECYHDLIDDGPLDFLNIYVLATAELYHDIDSDNVDLTQVFIMALAGCYHTVDIEGPLALGQLHRLKMEVPLGHSYHLHYADNIEFSALIKLYDTTIRSWRSRRAS
jgi:hypothetical protein